MLVKKLTPPPRKLRKSSPLSLRRRKLNLMIGKLRSQPKLRLLPLRQPNWRLPSKRPPRKSLKSEKKLTRRLLSPTLSLPKEKSSRLPSRLLLFLRKLRFKRELIRLPLTSPPSRRMLKNTPPPERKLSLRRHQPELN
jgi:hypothetical protein